MGRGSHNGISAEQRKVQYVGIIISDPWVVVAQLLCIMLCSVMHYLSKLLACKAKAPAGEGREGCV